MTTHADRWLAALADSLTWLARHPGRLNVLVRSDGALSSTRLGLSADQARAVARRLNAAVAVAVEEGAVFSDVDVTDFVRTEMPPDGRATADAVSLVEQLRDKFGEDSLPDGLEQHLADLSNDALSALAARLSASIRDLLGRHYPATEPLPQSLGSLEEAPRDGTEVWLLVESRVEMPVDEFVVAHWQAADRRWISESRFGRWRRADSNARGWLPIEAPRRDPALRRAFRRRWHGSDEDLRLRLGDAEAAG